MYPRVFSGTNSGRTSLWGRPGRSASSTLSAGLTGAVGGDSISSDSLEGGVEFTLFDTGAPSSARTVRTPAGKSSKVAVKQKRPAKVSSRFQNAGPIVTSSPRSQENLARVPGLDSDRARPAAIQSATQQNPLRSPITPNPTETLRGLSSAAGIQLKGVENAVISRPSQRRHRRRTPVRRGRRSEKVAKAQYSRRPPHIPAKSPNRRILLGRGAHTPCCRRSPTTSARHAGHHRHPPRECTVHTQRRGSPRGGAD